MATRTQGAALRSKNAVQSYARTGGKVMRPLCSVLDPSQWNTPPPRDALHHHMLTNIPRHTRTHNLTLAHNHKGRRNAERSVVRRSWMSGVSDESDGSATSRGSVLSRVVLC